MTLKREFAQTMVLQRFTQLLYHFKKPDLGYIPQLKPNRPMLNKVKKTVVKCKDLLTKHIYDKNTQKEWNNRKYGSEIMLYGNSFLSIEVKS